MRFSTKAIHAGQEPDPTTGAIMFPIYQTATYVQEAPGKHKGYEYSRTGNPTRTALEQNIAALEEGNYGLAFSSGCGATNTVMNLLSSGDHVIAGNDLYGGTYRLFTKVYSQYGLEFTFVDSRDPQQIENAIKDNTKMVWLETPSNPLLRLTDLKEAARICNSYGILCVVDNTFATPYLQQPFKYGVDIIVHSTTKYLGGHSDVVGGAIVVNDKTLRDKLAFYQNAVGATPGPFDCWLVLRGIKTLAVRMQKHCENAKRIAEFLDSHPQVTSVHYPGLRSYPQYELAKEQMTDFGGMVSFELKGDVQAGIDFITSTKVFSLAESLGGVESLIEHPASMTHASIPRQEREKAGLSDGLIRLSVGIEDIEDLIEDLEHAFTKI